MLPNRRVPPTRPVHVKSYVAVGKVQEDSIETLEQMLSRHISFFLFFRAFLPSLIPAYLADRPAYHAGHPSTQPSLSEHCSHYFMEFVPEFFCLLLKSIR